MPAQTPGRGWVICPLLAVALFVLLLTVAGIRGTQGRAYAHQRVAMTVSSSDQAYHIWKQHYVRGRTLILFDSYPHNMGYHAYNCAPVLTKTNFVEYSIFSNIIRRVYLIVPEDDWSDFRRQKFVRPIREATDVTKGLYLYNQSGIPLIAVTPSSLPSVTEPALVYINRNRFSSDEAMLLLDRKAITSDIIISQERTP